MREIISGLLSLEESALGLSQTRPQRLQMLKLDEVQLLLIPVRSNIFRFVVDHILHSSRSSHCRQAVEAVDVTFL
jgi:hypothetical protein